MKKPNHNNQNLRERRKELRKNQTNSEKKLWFQLRGNFLGTKFKRQESIGSYIVDFYCTKSKLIIEVEGKIHNFQKSYDLERENYFKSLNYKFLRFSDEEVEKNIDSVVNKIKNNL